jgi:hypothetical protein
MENDTQHGRCHGRAMKAPFMKTKLMAATGVALAVSVCAMTSGSSSATAAIIYTVDLPATGDLTLTGTITTDGTLGALTLRDFLDWDLTVFSASLSAGYHFLGPAHGPTFNSTLSLGFDNVAATATSLFLPYPGVFDWRASLHAVACHAVKPWSRLPLPAITLSTLGHALMRARVT